MNSVKPYTEPRIQLSPLKKLTGLTISMSLSRNKTYDLWRSFMPRLKEIKSNLNTDLISMQIYKSVMNLTSFNMETEFIKWAAVEVSDFDFVPDKMETFILEEGLYAVFDYKGPANNFAETFLYIFETWLPNSDYQADNRPHFEVLGAKYKNNDPLSEEEVWIPIKKKADQLMNRLS